MFSSTSPAGSVKGHTEMPTRLMNACAHVFLTHFKLNTYRLQGMYSQVLQRVSQQEQVSSMQGGAGRQTARVPRERHDFAEHCRLAYS